MVTPFYPDKFVRTILSGSDNFVRLCSTAGSLCVHGKSPALLSKGETRKKPDVSTLGWTMKALENRHYKKIALLTEPPATARTREIASPVRGGIFAASSQIEIPKLRQERYQRIIFVRSLG